MDNYSTLENKVSYRLLRVCSLLEEEGRHGRTYGTDAELYEAEIHLIKAIKESDGDHLTALAEKLIITKGAVSQVLARLQKKGMATKEYDPEKRSRLIIRLTEKGETAYAAHEKYHHEFDRAVMELLDGYSQEKQNAVLAFLRDVGGLLEKRRD